MNEFITIEFPKLSFAEPIDLGQVKQRELELWKNWNAGGQKPEDLRPLLRSFKPLIRKQANQWVSTGDVDIPPEAVYAEFNKQFVKALQTYDPDKGQLGSWVTGNLRKAKRWMATYRHPARMGESRFYMTGQYDRAKAYLNDQLGREPSTIEIADYMQQPVAEIGRLEMEKRKSLPSGGWEFDPTTISPSKEAEALRLAMYEMTPQEQLVAEYTLGMNGKPTLKAGEIAVKLGVSASKVSHIRAAITDKLSKYMR